MEVWLLRHAETEWSRDGRHTGRTDVPLTDGGRERARALRERIAGREFALVLSSPLSRARETAELAGLTPELRDDMRTETSLFFDYILRENRPLGEFLNARYTFLNERLAKHYGIEGVKGPDFGGNLALDTGTASILGFEREVRVIRRWNG